MMLRHLIFAVTLLGPGCASKSDQDPAMDMPVANSWTGQAAPSQGESDPHAGLDMGGADPHAGLDMGGADPHAGLDMGGADPHAGLDMGAQELGGLEPPDPNRKIDPSMFLKGALTASKSTAGLLRPGSIVFVSVRPVNKATGESLGSPIAVERFEVQKLPQRFHLSGEQSMVAGTAFEGDVMIYARMDGDGEASTTMPGDVEGSVMATIPASGLSLVLDSVVGAK